MALPLAVNPADITFHEGLTPLQNAYIYFRQQGLTSSQAAKRAGYEEPVKAGRMNEQNAQIRTLIEQQERECRVDIQIDRGRVVEGMLEALAVAREQSDAKVMLDAWDRIARVTGVGAPETKKIDISVDGQISHNVLTKASDSELLALVGKYRELPKVSRKADPDPLEGEFEVEDEDSDDVEEDCGLVGPDAGPDEP